MSSGHQNFAKISKFELGAETFGTFKLNQKPVLAWNGKRAELESVKHCKRRKSRKIAVTCVTLCGLVALASF